MQDIERYGLITLLFLVASVTAVFLWDGSEAEATREVAGPTPEERREARSEALASQRLTAATPTSARVDGVPPARHAAGEERRATRSEDATAARASGPGAERVGAGPRGGAGADPGPTARASAPQNRPAAAERPVPSALAPEGATADRERVAVENVTALAEGATATPPRSGRDLPLTRPVIVAQGDSLWVIAERELGQGHLASWLEELNPGLDPRRLKIGQSILVPTAHALALREAARSRAAASTKDSSMSTPSNPVASNPVATQPAATQPAATQPVASSAGAKSAATSDAAAAIRPGGEYRVQEGESAWIIAKRLCGAGSRYTELAPLNPGVDLGALKAGRTLRLPADWNGARPVEVASSGERRRSGVR